VEAKILAVDDEREIADLVELYLKNEGFTVYKCYDGDKALELIQSQPMDLALLDVMLPGIDGFELCRVIRESYTYPVIMLTARGEELDKINGLALGADDYITKPFSPLEMVARVKAQLRRARRYNEGALQAGGDVIDFSGIVIDRAARTCLLNDRPLSLTPLEFNILWLLCENRGKVISCEQLFRQVWGEKYFTNSNNTVMVHIRHLREKMGDKADKPKYIKTVWGVGYKIDG
jgi:two-component system response regulator VanR